MGDNLKKLEELTTILRFKDMHGTQRGSEYQIRTDRGTFLIFGLMKEKDIAIAKAFASKDTFVPFHIHNGSSEWIGVFRGKMKIVFRNRESIVLNPGNAANISAFEEHALEFDCDTWLWAVTIPGERGFPCSPLNNDSDDH